jgi:3'-phosphoadenosine 5'-phosphosulfate sulfotransferase (PAPS reductase)/FAD synthetase
VGINRNRDNAGATAAKVPGIQGEAMKRDPFRIDGPTCISFSGGRTSAYMLWRVLQSNGGLPDDAKVIFANTGREDERTLLFVDECSRRWGVPIDWVEYADSDLVAFRWACVDYATASRHGQPFTALNRRKKYLPTAMQRYCTINLKILPAANLMRDYGYSEWENLVGIRADEQRRVAKIRAKPVDDAGCERRMPLADVGITKSDVMAFWRDQAFDLGDVAGNCDLCFLKPTGQLVSLIKEKPNRAVWWVQEEAWAQTRVNDANSRGIHFRPNDPTYLQMQQFAADQRDMFDAEEEAIACFCGD